MSTTAAALTLAGTATTGTHSQFTGFSRKGKGPMFPPYVPGGGGPSGSGPGGPAGGGPPGGGRGGGGPPRGGGFFPAIAPGAGGVMIDLLLLVVGHWESRGEFKRRRITMRRA